MTDKRRYDLLRPFDLTEVLAGEPICTNNGDDITFVAAGVDDHCIRLGQWHTGAGSLALWNEEYLRMAPLTWIDHKPVYKGDTLYIDLGAATPCTVTVIEGCSSSAFGADANHFLHVQHVAGPLVGTACMDHIDDLMWDAPQTAAQPDEPIVVQSCPLCGGVSRVVERYVQSDFGINNQTAWCVECDDCECSTSNYANSLAAVMAWNKRITPSIEAVFEVESGDMIGRIYCPIKRVENRPGGMIRVTIDKDPPPAPNLWRPICTAPRDGTVILIYRQYDDAVYAATWDPKYDYSFPWMVFDGNSEVDGFVDNPEKGPTLWMPLPTMTTHVKANKE